MIGLDFVAAGNVTSIPIPKYNNKVQNPDIFDRSTRVVLPRSMLRMPSSSGKYNTYWLSAWFSVFVKACLMTLHHTNADFFCRCKVASWHVSTAAVQI